MKTKVIIVVLLIILIILLFAVKHFIDNSVVDKHGMVRVTEDETISVIDASSDNS